MVQTCEVVKIKPVFILPLHLTFIGEVVDSRLWSTTGHQSQDQPKWKRDAFQRASSLSSDQLIHHSRGAEFKPNRIKTAILPFCHLEGANKTAQKILFLESRGWLNNQDKSFYLRKIVAESRMRGVGTASFGSKYHPALSFLVDIE